ncbi:50S ribosomal protein L3 [Halomonas alkalicola]|uniref:Large ribosomal subunit protein uL3 n=1 Tax=Halomonas alkalicola TaxID=1930622 RepID=A0ABY9H2F1_9GAMM|nr:MULTISPECIES: 50S ribosomal protein L3 [Halomonas]AXY43135.1 50S ribosomal protein L3 [Halomonas sp. JS92-SW72]QJR00402.1 50S ribosomal protein L3 [Halomonas sp. PGE1]WLI72418.1 50S ribosomal protein L3 [Halomonas alkalicola]
MTIGLVGKKAGMTRVFTEDGASVPVTVIEVAPNRITRVKTVESDGYAAIQVTAGSRKAKHLTKAQAGQYAKAGVEAGRSLMEFRLAAGEEAPEVGGELTVSLFEAGQKIDVTGTSKGKGFQGAIKRWNFRTQDNSHGNSLSHRAPGSIGMCQTPGRVFKGKKMAGQMGNVRCTVQSLEVVRVDAERNLLLVKGAVPGATGSDVVVRSAVKAG